jgi:hypothetical protein
MKKLLAFLWALFRGRKESEVEKLGSEGDPIRQMLFASQSLKEQVTRRHHDGTAGPFQAMAEASKLVEAGAKEEAITRLRSVLVELPQRHSVVILMPVGAASVSHSLDEGAAKLTNRNVHSKPTFISPRRHRWRVGVGVDSGRFAYPDGSKKVSGHHNRTAERNLGNRQRVGPSGK